MNEVSVYVYVVLITGDPGACTTYSGDAYSSDYQIGQRRTRRGTPSDCQELRSYLICRLLPLTASLRTTPVSSNNNKILRYTSNNRCSSYKSSSYNNNKNSK